MFMKRNRRAWQVLLIGAMFTIAGFLFAAPFPAQSAPKGEATIVFGELFVMNGGDCHTVMGAGGVNIANLIHEGLVKEGLDGRITPALAKSWQISKDELSIKFTLDERARFHNGEPVTAADVKFSIERTMRPELKYVRGAEMRRNFDRIEIADDHHLTVHFKSPFPAFFEYSIQHLGIIPKAYVEKVGDQEFAKHPIGAGPFRWIDYQQDVFIDAEAVENHYRKVPQIKTLHCKFLTEEATITSMFKAGEADVVQLPLSTYAEVKNDPKLRVVLSKFIYGPSLAYWDLAFPNEPSPFHDVRVRRAASYAINRKAICERVLHGAAEPWGDILAPYHPGVNPNLKPDPYDPEKAKALLKEAGYPNGFDTKFICGLLGDKIEAQAIAADLARVGIRAKLVELEFGTYISTMQQKGFRGLGRTTTPFWNGQFHPGMATETFLSSANFWSYATTPQIDAAWKKLCGMNNEKAIAAQARELSRIYRESEVRYMLWAVHQPFGISSRVKSFTPIPGRKQIMGLEYLELKD